MADTPLAITLEAMTSGAGIGNSPNRGILNVATVSSLDKISLVSGRFVGIVSGVSATAAVTGSIILQSVVNQLKKVMTKIFKKVLKKEIADNKK